MKGKYSVSCLSLVAMLSGCAPAQEQITQLPAATSSVIAETAPLAAAVPLAEPVFDTATPLNQLMNNLIQPSADTIWTAVSYVITSEGTTETQPETTEDWERLRTSALALIEAGNALMLPGRQVAAEVAAEYPEFQYRPDEIEAQIAADPASWNGYAQDMQALTRDTLRAIEFRDLMGLTDFGARINEACQNCHSQFWYRPLGMPDATAP